MKWYLILREYWFFLFIANYIIVEVKNQYNEKIEKPYFVAKKGRPFYSFSKYRSHATLLGFFRARWQVYFLKKHTCELHFGHPCYLRSFEIRLLDNVLKEEKEEQNWFGGRHCHLGLV